MAKPGPLRAISLCAGQGRDLISALAGHPRRYDVRARLVELDPRNTETARQAAQAAGLPRVEVVTGDAALTDTYAGIRRQRLRRAVGVRPGRGLGRRRHRFIGTPDRWKPGPACSPSAATTPVPVLPGICPEKPFIPNEPPFPPPARPSSLVTPGHPPVSAVRLFPAAPPVPLAHSLLPAVILRGRLVRHCPPG